MTLGPVTNLVSECKSLRLRRTMARAEGMKQLVRQSRCVQVSTNLHIYAIDVTALAAI